MEEGPKGLEEMEMVVVTIIAIIVTVALFYVVDYALPKVLDYLEGGEE